MYARILLITAIIASVLASSELADSGLAIAPSSVDMPVIVDDIIKRTPLKRRLP
jgi:hypothetical protein